MHVSSQMSPGLYSRARRKQAELWDDVTTMLAGEWERGWSPSWRVELRLHMEELMEDLEYGQK
ncbi:MAG: hypothetical protein JRE81_09235 [Deltaproteobacteria bacterium]|jgi:hypothetical protein|nr:hypothetical protein [Deltaproteobacteria bacterium]